MCSARQHPVFQPPVVGSPLREVLEWPYTRGEAPPPPQTNVAIVGQNEIYKREDVVRPLLAHKTFGSQTTTSPSF